MEQGIIWSTSEEFSVLSKKHPLGYIQCIIVENKFQSYIESQDDSERYVNIGNGLLADIFLMVITPINDKLGEKKYLTREEGKVRVRPKLQMRFTCSFLDPIPHTKDTALGANEVHFHFHFHIHFRFLRSPNNMDRRIVCR